MAILDYTIQPCGNACSELAWTGTGWVYVNGYYVCGPDTDGCIIPFNFTDANAIEVHDQRTDPAINEIPATRPLIRWRIDLDNQVDQFNLYHTPKGGTREKVLSFPDNQTDEFYVTQMPEDLATGWHFFEVTAQTGSTETTVEAFPYRVNALPLCASNIEAANGSGSGLFDITVTPGV